MFVARTEELNILEEQLQQETRTVVLVYGKRRIGKSTLIRKAAEQFRGTVINHLCIQSTYDGNMVMLSRSICQALRLPEIQFRELDDLFRFLEAQNQKILLVLDEYQYLKNTKRRNEIDSILQGIVDQLSGRIKLILCGSYISVMKELLEEENPLFGRFTSIIHLEELNYYDASGFYQNVDTKRKIDQFAIFGGSPYVLSVVDIGRTIRENIIRLLLPETGILRSYIENVMLREIQKSFDIRILEVIGNGKKKYSELENILGDSKGLLDKQLKNLIGMETIEKIAPINRQKDKRKQFYSIRDNLMRFYFTYIFGNTGVIERIGEDAYYDQMIAPSLAEFISRRFEKIVNQYFQCMTKSGRIKEVLDIGSLWYDDPMTKSNGEFDCVLKRKNGYDFYECKYYQTPMGLGECKKEAEQISELRGVAVQQIGFVCLSGFDFWSEEYQLISGSDLFSDFSSIQ